MVGIDASSTNADLALSPDSLGSEGPVRRDRPSELSVRCSAVYTYMRCAK